MASGALDSSSGGDGAMGPPIVLGRTPGEPATPSRRSLSDAMTGAVENPKSPPAKRPPPRGPEPPVPPPDTALDAMALTHEVHKLNMKFG